MRIAHVFPIFSISRGGGTTWLICELAKHQSKKHEVTIVTSNYELDIELKKELENYGIKFFIHKSFFNKLGLYLMPGLIFNRKLFKKNEIYHLHLYRSFQNLIILYKSRFKKSFCIIDAHGSIPKHNIKTLKKLLFDLFFKNFILKNTKFFIAENWLSYNECISIGVKKNKIEIINPPFPIKDFEDAQNLNILEEKFKIKEKYILLYFGRFHYIKGLDFLVKSFNQLRKIRDDVHLVFMGKDDGYEKTMLKLINKMKLNSKITIIGFKSGTEKNSIVKESTICIQPSRYEQGAGVPFESVLLGTPIIVSSHSGSAEDVKRYDAGYFTRFNDINNLVDQIIYILDNEDVAIKKTLKASNKIKLKLSIEKVNKHYIQLYEKSIIKK